MRPTRWRRSTRVAIGAAALLLVAVVVAVTAVLIVGRSDSSAANIPPLPAPVTASAHVVPVGDAAPPPTERGLAAALAPALADPNLGDLTGRVTDAVTGEQLWAQRAGVPMQPASTNKVLTAAAALLTLDRDARLTTTVVAADQRTDPGLVILKGGGDTTLSAAPRGTESWYRDAARIGDLADQVRRSGIEVTAVGVDISAYTGPNMAVGWDPLDIGGGDIAPMAPVMLDGGRTQPVSENSRRSTTPATDAGRALAVALGIDPATVTVRPAPATGARQIAAVQSPPLMERLRVMMNASDNVMAESIGREVAAQLGRPQSFDGAVAAVLGQLRSAGVDTAGATLHDSSGLSVDDRLTAFTLDEVVTTATGDDQPELRPLVDLLPVAGGSGTLSNRYLDTEAGRDAAGWLRAKTGSLTGTNSLAGFVTDARGRVLTFALMSNNAGPNGRNSLDAVAATLRACGCGS
ncbi:D-alanyl-D-alanine carboxypeptidase/D-alanyl-D-alanine endopeptidase [Mycobacterium sp. WMMD1722]|uniref:D-alanyl-D-alanine carboxypeptidase/D-alanyl-D-alanine endopeptidase n=1 Tax=Mycobacterium sp. WMMD1722 TaxID=3404117 RepID=UPI003BF4C5E8